MGSQGLFPLEKSYFFKTGPQIASCKLASPYLNVIIQGKRFGDLCEWGG
jgi:hypothetical protein